MVANYGMSDKLGAVYYDHDAEHPFLGHSVATDSGTSDATTFAIEAEARETLGVALAGAIATVKERRVQLDALVHALLEHESLEQKDLLSSVGAVAKPARARSDPPVGVAVGMKPRAAARPAAAVVRLSVRAKPRASKSRIVSVQGFELEVALAAAPVDGAANEALLELLASALAIRQSALRLVLGQASKHKLVEVSGLSVDEVSQRLAPFTRA